jgi:HSP20 family molecular chaperone IbpA
MNSTGSSTRQGKNAKTENWTPALDIMETPENYRIKVDVPGMTKENIDISVSGNVLIKNHSSNKAG